MKKIIFIIPICLSLLMISCIDDIDLNQAKKLKLKPKFSLAVFKFNLSAKELVEGTTEKTELKQLFKFNIFNEEDIFKESKKLDFKFNATNKIDREFKISITCFNDKKEKVFEFEQMVIPPKENFSFSRTITSTEETLIKSTSHVETVVNISPSGDGSILDPLDPELFSFHSGVDLQIKM